MKTKFGFRVSAQRGETANRAIVTAARQQRRRAMGMLLRLAFSVANGCDRFCLTRLRGARDAILCVLLPTVPPTSCPKPRGGSSHDPLSLPPVRQTPQSTG